jgi:hypothetical protein
MHGAGLWERDEHRESGGREEEVKIAQNREMKEEQGKEDKI